MSLGDARAAWRALSPAEQWHCFESAVGDVQVLRARLSHTVQCLARMHDARRVAEQSAVLHEFQRFASDHRTSFELRGEDLIPRAWLRGAQIEADTERATATKHHRPTDDGPV
jgi:hypothetical protein